MALAGLGIGPGLPLFTLVVQNAVGDDVVGQATSTSQFARQFGGTVASAVMGTVLVTSLSTSPDLAPVPPGGTKVVQRVAPLGSGGGGTGIVWDATERLRRALDAHLRELVTDLRADDAAAFERTLRAGPLPTELREAVRERAVAAPGDARRIEVFELQMRSRLDASGEELERVVREALRDAFARAVADVFRALSWLALLRLVAALAGPSATLRRSFQQAS